MHEKPDRVKRNWLALCPGLDGLTFDLEKIRKAELGDAQDISFKRLAKKLAADARASKINLDLHKPLPTVSDILCAAGDKERCCFSICFD